ncbi:SBNO2 protein, partial [Corythaixoides concolor]|nr:SBNO2 protein [Corythaixoides concolor]
RAQIKNVPPLRSLFHLPRGLHAAGRRLMPSAHPTMDGGKNYPQHEHQQSGNTLYSIPHLRSQLAVPAMENSMLAANPWSSCYPASSPTSSFSSENQQYFNSSHDFYMNSISRPHFLDTNYASVDSTDFIPKNGDFPQDSSYLDELSNNNSLFSSPADSLSDIADPKDFLPADSLNHVPTLWDVSTPQQNQIEVRAAPLPSSS